MGTHIATWVPTYQYPAGTRVPGYWVFRALNGYPGSTFITRVVPLPAGTRVPVYSSTICSNSTPGAPFWYPFSYECIHMVAQQKSTKLNE